MATQWTRTQTSRRSPCQPIYCWDQNSISDPETCCQELIFEHLLTLLLDRPYLELDIISSNFQVSLFSQDKSLEFVWDILVAENFKTIARPALQLGQYHFLPLRCFWAEIALGMPPPGACCHYWRMLRKTRLKRTEVSRTRQGRECPAGKCMTSSGWSMKEAISKKKRFKQYWGGETTEILWRPNLLCVSRSYRISFECVSGVFLDFSRI